MVLHFFFLLCAALGLFHLCKLMISSSRWVWASFLMPMKDLKQYGSWAIVTGPTDGIGKALAFGLASHGLNLVLVGRNPSKLRAVSSSILENFGNIQIKSIVIDFNGEIESGMRKMKEEIDDLDIGILINNAGTTYPYSRYFHEADAELTESIIKVNLEAVTRVSRLVLPGMLKKRRGAIVNIGSAAGSFLPSYPLGTVYGSTKAYVHHFSRSLHMEYKEFGIDVQCQAPFFVATKMADVKPSFFTPTAEKYADWCLRRVGSNEAVCTPYWTHSLEWLGMSLLPEPILNRLIFRIMLRRRHQGRLTESSIKQATHHES